MGWDCGLAAPLRTLATSSPPDEIDSDGESTAQEKRGGDGQTRCSQSPEQCAEHRIERERELPTEALQKLDRRSRNTKVRCVYLIAQHQKHYKEQHRSGNAKAWSPSHVILHG